MKVKKFDVYCAIVKGIAGDKFSQDDLVRMYGEYLNPKHSIFNTGALYKDGDNLVFATHVEKNTKPPKKRFFGFNLRMSRDLSPDRLLNIAYRASMIYAAITFISRG